MTGPEPPTDLHLPLGSIVLWATPVVTLALSALVALWNRSQERELGHLAESIRALRDLHESQEKRFDEREKTLRHELGAQSAVALARAEAMERRQQEMLEAWHKCRENHNATAVRREDLQALSERISRLTSEFVALKDSVIAHHAREEKHDT